MRTSPVDGPCSDGGSTSPRPISSGGPCLSIPVRLLEYTRSWNLGDEIQTLAVRQHIGSVAGYLDRDELDRVDGEPTCVVMQGWFAKRTETLRLAGNLRPVWVGFHLDPNHAAALRHPAVRARFEATGPIGCRDERTATQLADAGIEAHVTGCLTTTFPRRLLEPEEARVYLVDTSGVPLPERLRGPASVRVTHQGAPWWSADAKRRLAGDLLSEYRDHASLVVTTRLHCALPCVAMGIPVVFVGDPSDSRLQPILSLAEVVPFPADLRREALRSRVTRRSLWWREMRGLPWTGQAPDIESHKERLISLLRRGLEHVGA